VIDSCHGLVLGHGSQVMRVTGQLNDGSRVTNVTHDCQLCLTGLFKVISSFIR